MGKIHLLSENLINKIAAGEVIERPASVIKELVENSIDAGSDEIEINVEDGGTKSISIFDNGSGMTPEDAELCYQLHTTSKITGIEDLEKIYTLGFRGEALASICAVSEVTIHTKSKNNKAIKLIVENSKLINKSFEQRRDGTSIEVQDIFRHLPARKKFLKSTNTEYRHILNVVTKFALIYPHISFTLSHNQKRTLELKKTDLMQERINDLFPNFEAKDLIEIKYASPLFELIGYTVHPNKLSHDRSRQFLYINKRVVADKSLNKAIKDGYGTSIPYEKQPAYFLNINIDASQVDVNIHPRKDEVRISNISELFRAVKISIDQAIKKSSHEELMSKLGNERGNMPSTFKYELKDTGSQFNQVNDSNDIRREYFPRSSSGSVQQSLNFTNELLNQGDISTSNYFQLFNTYILIPSEDKIQIVDQHAADERINYEIILKRLENEEKVETQSLLLPISVGLSIEDMEIIANNIELIREMGLDIDVFGATTLKVNSIPQFSREVNYDTLISEMISDFKENNKIEKSNLTHKLAASLACHGSIRAGKVLSQIEMKKIVNDLFKCDLPYSCPHGRPIIWTLNKYDFEKKFERIK